MHLIRASQVGVLAAVAILLVSLAQAQGDGPGRGPWSRLESVPLAYREELASKMREFAALPRDRQQAIRDLDARIASLDPADRDRYLSLLRRFHVWLQDQPEVDRPALKEGATDDRIRRIAQLQAKGRPAPTGRAAPATIEPSNLLGQSPFSLAFQIKTWMALTDEQRRQVEGPKGGTGFSARAQKLNELGKQLKIEVAAPETSETERLQKRATDAIFLREFPNGSRVERILEKAAAKQAITGKPARIPLKYAVNHLTDSFWLAENQKPVQVNEANLQRFEDEIPEWLRATFDSLPPAESRHRLALIYRMAYPQGTEMPPSKTPPKTPLVPTPVAPSSPGGVSF